MKKFGLLLTILLVVGLTGCGKSDNKTETKKEFEKNSYIISKKYLMGLLSYTEFMDLITYNNNMMV